MNNFYKNTISREMLNLLRKLMQDENLKDFRLVGGTALSLLIGHRKSIDIDFFTDKNFDVLKLFEHLYESYSYVQSSFSNVGTRGFIGMIKCDFFNHHHSWIDQPVNIENIRIASLKEIAAMKIYAIIESHGERLKDFVDIAFLSEHFSLKQMLELFQKKYKGYSDTLVLKSIFYFDNIDFTKPIELINNKFNWKDIEKKLNYMQQHIDKKL